MNDFPTHPSLRSAAGLTAALGVSGLLLFFFICAFFTSDLVGGSSEEPVVWLILGVILIIVLAPVVALLYCVKPIGRASKVAVTVALVVSSLVTLALGLTFLQFVLRLLVFMRFLGRLPPASSILPFLIITALLAGFIVNIVKLGRCYRVINEIRYGGRRGFEPLVPSMTHPAPRTPPEQWPDITE